jgi:hypothetical protein
VILGFNEPEQKQDGKPRSEREEPPARQYSDQLYSQNARTVYERFMIEPVYLDGQPCGEYRVCRRRADGNEWRKMQPEAILPSKEDALEWCKLTYGS